MFVEAADGTRLWWELQGSGSTVVLIPGRGDASDVYPRVFVDQLVAAGLSALKLDPRDTGLSGDGGDTYTLATMADDVVAVMNDAGVERAHVIGLSMGGLILLDLATRYRGRVISTAFLSAMSPDPDAGTGPNFFAGIGSDPVEGTLAAMGSPSDADRTWLVDEVAHARTRAEPRPEAGERHQAAAFRVGWPELSHLAAVDGPALVMHGTADQSLPLAHAQALADGLPDVRLHVLDGMGHLPTEAEWMTIAALVVAAVERAR